MEEVPVKARVPWTAILAVLALAFLGGFVYWLRAREAAQGLPVYYSAPRFALVNQDGRRVTDTDLRGHVWLVDFVFTNCPSTCPTLGSRYYEIAEQFPPDVKLVSITVDPERDTPERMRDFSKKMWKADHSRWWWLTGDRRYIYGLMQDGFKVGEPDAPAGNDIPHTPHVLLFDARGRLRGTYEATDYEGVFKARLLPDLRKLYEEQKLLVHVRRLPSVNASLNAFCTVLLIAGWLLIRARRQRAHQYVMVAACLTSALFLACYLLYHYFVGSVRFAGTGWIRPVYYAILISHVVLAAAIVPLVLVTLWRALGGHFERHRRIARWTMPLWLYVSVTGVVVYVLLYIWVP